jgi:hypothetical protein
VKQTGYLNEFFRVYASEDTKANVLSFADVEDLYDVTYVRGENFVVHLPSRDLEFVRHGKLYVADFANAGLVHATRVITKGEEARAKGVQISEESRVPLNVRGHSDSREWERREYAVTYKGRCKACV